MNALNLMESLSIIYDPRQAGKIEHKLADILLLTMFAVIAGAEGWKDIEDFGHERLDWLKQYGEFKNGIPSLCTGQNLKQYQKVDRIIL